MSAAQPDELDPERAASRRLTRQALRMAFAATLAFGFAEYQGWEFSFLAPMLVIQFLSVTPFGIRPVQAFAVPFILGGACFAALILSTLLGGNPGVLLLVVGLIVFWAFYGERAGKPGLPLALIRMWHGSSSWAVSQRQQSS